MLTLYDSVKIPKELSTELKDVLAKLLEKDPSQRIKMEELRVRNYAHSRCQFAVLMTVMLGPRVADRQWR